MEIASKAAQMPHLTTDQMREVDRAMIEDLHIELIQMMENAGRSLAHLARMRFLGGDPRGGRVVVLTGEAFDPSIRATATVTLALPKEGLRKPAVRDVAGEVYLADISVPPALYGSRLGLEVEPLFARSDIIRLF